MFPKPIPAKRSVSLKLQELSDLFNKSKEKSVNKLKKSYLNVFFKSVRESIISKIS